MTRSENSHSSRRDFLKQGSRAAAATTILLSTAPQVFAGEDNTIRLALVGAGGRGTGAVLDAFAGNKSGPIQLVAMVDVFEKRLAASYEHLAAKPEAVGKMAVPEDQRFIGFDGYKKAMDCLRPGDIVILATPPGFRWVHYTYAIEKGLNVFMEKPVSVDGPTTVRMLELNKRALAKDLKVGVGFMCRHCPARQELFERIQNGEIGDINMMRAYRLTGPTGSAAIGPKSASENELLYQIANFHAFLWLSGGAVSDFLIHNIDESCWMKDAWPIQATAIGGRHYRGDDVDQNFDNYAIEYTFEDGAKLFAEGRTMPGCHGEFASYAHGTKGMAVISSAAHSPAKSRIYAGQHIKKSDLRWAYGEHEPNPYEVEWEDLIAAVRENRPYNEVERGAMASLVTSMGRMAAHTGQLITLDEMMNCGHEFAPDIDKLTMDSPAPLLANEEGKYPIPYPGLMKNREYA